MPELKIIYHTEQKYCGCCNQKLEQPKISKARNFTITKDDLEKWDDKLSERIKDDPEYLHETAINFTFETIRFFAVDSGHTLKIEPDEITKVVNFIKENFCS